MGPEDLDREDLQEYLHNIHENNLDSESLIEDSLDNVHKIYMDYFNRPHDIRLDDNVIVLDNGAEESLMHSLNLFINENIYEADEPINIGGVSEDWGLLIINEGETIFGQSYHSNHISNNILSFARAVDECRRVYYCEEEDKFYVQPKPNSDTYIFSRDSDYYNQYICNIDKDLIPYRAVASTTVSQNLTKYSPREIMRADKAKLYIKRLGYISPSNLIKLIKRNKIKNCEINEQDVARAYDIYGRDLASIKGKTKRNNASVYEREYNIVPRVVKEFQILYIDIMFVNAVPYLLGKTSPPLNFRNARKLASTKAAEIFKKLRTILNIIKSSRIKIVFIRSDEESGIDSDEMLHLLTQYDDSIQLEISAGGEAVGVIERDIQTVKNAVRSIVVSLFFICDELLEMWLVLYVIYYLNWTPSQSNVEFKSAHEILLGRTIDAKTDLKYSFGDYIQIADGDTDNSMDERTRGCLALMPASHDGTIWYFLVIKNWTVIRRSTGIVNPLPDVIIECINEKATTSRQKRALAYEGITLGLWRGGTMADPLTDPLDLSDDYYNDIDIVESYIPSYIEPDLINNNLFLDIDSGEATESFIPVPPSEGINPGPSTEQDTHDVDTYRDLIEDLDEEIHSYDIDPLSDSIQTVIDNNIQDLSAGNITVPEPLAVSRAPEEQDLQYTSDPPKRYNTRSSNQSTIGRYDKRTVGMIQEVANAVGRSNAWRNHAQKERKSLKIFNMSVKYGIKEYGYDAVLSIVKEVLQLHELDSFAGVDANELSGEEQARIISSMTFLKAKYKPDGSFDKLKARLVAGGHLQDRDIYDNGNSPTASTSSVFMIAAIAAKERRAVAKIDFPGAFLNAEMPNIPGKDVYVTLNQFEAKVLMKIDKKYENYLRKDGKITVKLKRALYGCVESARLWYDKLTSQLIELNYKVNEEDICVFNRIEYDGSQSTMIIHVDDIMLTAKSEENITGILNELQKLYPKLEIERGRIINYLGMQFDFSMDLKCKVTMDGYIQDLLEFCTSVPDQAAATPARDNLFKIDSKSDQLDKDNKEYYHTVTAKLLYLGKRVRPELLTAVSFLTKRVNAPTKQDLNKLFRVIQYIRGSKELGIILEGSINLGVYAYVDASYGTHEDFKSHTGCVIGIGKGPIYVKSHAQKINSKSSSEAELIGLSDSSGQIIWVRNFLIAQGYDVPAATVYEDNMSTIAMVKNGKATNERTRHIAVRFYFIADRVQSNEIKIEYMCTEDMIADILTKPLNGALFIKLRALLLNWPTEDMKSGASQSTTSRGVL